MDGKKSTNPFDNVPPRPVVPQPSSHSPKNAEKPLPRLKSRETPSLEGQLPSAPTYEEFVVPTPQRVPTFAQVTAGADDPATYPPHPQTLSTKSTPSEQDPHSANVSPSFSNSPLASRPGSSSGTQKATPPRKMQLPAFPTIRDLQMSHLRFPRSPRAQSPYGTKSHPHSPRMMHSSIPEDSVSAPVSTHGSAYNSPYAQGPSHSVGDYFSFRKPHFSGLMSGQTTPMDHPKPATPTTSAINKLTDEMARMQMTTPAIRARERPRLMILVYIHGFRGGSHTFGTMPQTCASHLNKKLGDLCQVVTAVYPPYVSLGELHLIVGKVLDWLHEQIERLSRENEHAGQPAVFLVGHSMGGFVAADVAKALAKECAAKHTRSPIAGLVAYDTPFFGLHKSVFDAMIRRGRMAGGKAGAIASKGPGMSTVADVINGINDVTSTQTKHQRKLEGSPKVSTKDSFRVLAKNVGSSVAQGYKAVKEEGGLMQMIENGYHYIEGHYSFLKELWATDRLRARNEFIITGVENDHFRFHCWYNLLPKNLLHTKHLTFIKLPNKEDEFQARFIPYFSPGRAANERDILTMHAGMFYGQGMSELADDLHRLILKWVEY